MKKIFTLLFAVGLAAAASAQSDRHSQYRDQSSDRRTPPAPAYQEQNGNRGNNQQQYQNQDQHGRYNNGYEQNQERDFHGRNDRGYDNDRRYDNDRFYHERQRRFFLFRFHRHNRW